MKMRHFCSALLVAVACSVAASPASAQLSRIKKAAQDKAKEAAGVTKEAPKNTDAAASRDYAITSERVDIMLKALAPAIQKAEREQAARTARTDYEAKVKGVQNCMESAMKAKGATMATPDAASMEKSAKLAARASDLAQRMSAAHTAGRYTEYLFVKDTMEVMQFEMTGYMVGISSCGKIPYRPASLIAAEVEDLASKNSGAGRGTVVDAANRGGLTYQQFGMIRERIAVWSLQQTGNAKPDGGKYATYTDAEHAAMNGRVAELKKLAPLFKGGTLGWNSWNDLAEW